MDVYEFDPQVYPIKFWVLIGGTTKTIEDTFIDLYGNALGLSNKFNNTELYDAFVCNKVVMYKKTEKYGFILHINNLDDITSAVMAHEATHLAGYTWIHLNEFEIGSECEANAYLVEWFVDSINTAIEEHKSKNKKEEIVVY
jgi:hypothetical protein